MATIDVKSLVDKNKSTIIQWQVNKESKRKVQNFMKKNKIQFRELFDELANSLDDYEISMKK
mgnify:CR=1 FL=1